MNPTEADALVALLLPLLEALLSVEELDLLVQFRPRRRVRVQGS